LVANTVQSNAMGNLDFNYHNREILSLKIWLTYEGVIIECKGNNTSPLMDGNLKEQMFG
jgi:hypothetical protein